MDISVIKNSYDSLEHLNDSTHEYILFYNDFRPHYHLNGKTPNEFEKAYLIKNGSSALLSEQSTLELKIKKTFTSGQFNQKGSKVFV